MERGKGSRGPVNLQMLADEPSRILSEQLARYRSARHRLAALEQWYELGDRPDPATVVDTSIFLLDKDLLEKEEDDLGALKIRCEEARAAVWEARLPPPPDPHLRVGPSGIPGAGLGLFAAQDIEADTYVCSYLGKVHTMRSARALEDKSYLMRVGPPPSSGLAWWCEGSLNPHQLPMQDHTTSCMGGEGRRGDREGARTVDGRSRSFGSASPSAGSCDEIATGCCYVDPRDDRDIKARYINDPLNPAGHNVRFAPDRRAECSQVFSLRKIRAGEELWVDYGKSYWEQNRWCQPHRLSDAELAACGAKVASAEQNGGKEDGS